MQCNVVSCSENLSENGYMLWVNIEQQEKFSLETI